MIRLLYILIPALFLVSQLALAQSSIVAPSPNSRASLDLYNSPNAAQPAKQIPVSEAAFPLNISGTQSGFFQVNIGGQEFWLKGAQVRITRKVDADCSLALKKTERTGATPGAGSDACK